MNAASRIVGLIAWHAERHALGWPRGQDGEALLTRTVTKLQECAVDRVIIVGPGALPDIEGVTHHETTLDLFDTHHTMQIAARKFSPRVWRGGVAGATCYDEVIHPTAMVEALETHRATAALIVGPDWCEIDPTLCDQVIARHLNQPDDFRMVFTQAPAGRCGVLVATDLLAELRDNQTSIGMMLDYNPRMPQGDPIARDMCVQISAAQRSQPRCTHDAPRWCEKSDLPQLVEVELTTNSPCTGPITPQHHVPFDREAMSLESAERLFEQLAVEPDVSVILGGLGDALAHPQWQLVVQAAHDAGVWGIALRTDLLVEQAELEQILALPLDAVIVNINADQAETYAKLMGRDALDQVRSNIEWLLKNRRNAHRPGLPWVVPTMIKTQDNVEELESFFDRWMFFCGQALVNAPTTGGGLMEDQAVLNMAPPRRFACRQLALRMSVLSNGTVARCDQDWLGRAAVGHVNDTNVVDLWSQLQSIAQQHEVGQYEDICTNCREWHRP